MNEYRVTKNIALTEHKQPMQNLNYFLVDMINTISRDQEEKTKKTTT